MYMQTDIYTCTQILVDEWMVGGGGVYDDFRQRVRKKGILEDRWLYGETYKKTDLQADKQANDSKTEKS